jgi:NADH pyrophosphatase NudC (nudix superfamily)
VKKLVTFVAAVFRIAKMLFTMWAAVVGCVKINHTMSATKRNQTILQNLTDNHPFRPVGGSCAMTENSAEVPCVGGLSYDADRRLLLVRRRNKSGRGLWSVRGGRVEPGESDAEAVVREMAKETGLVHAVTSS